MKRGYDRRQVADALMFPSLPRSLANTLSDPALDRATILPVGRRTFTDPGDDITEERSLEFALPGLLYDPLMGAAKVSDMFAGAAPIDPNAVTQFMIDAPFAAGVLSAATGAAPKGAVLGANVFHGGPHRLLDDTASRMQRARDMGFDTDTTYYHGTTHDFNQFGGATGNVGGHFGAGHYATTSPIDASKNYAGVGPDLTGRIENRAERIAQEVMDDRGVSEKVANRYGRIVATRELKGQHEGAVLPLVARGKTADITGDNQTFLEYNYAGDFDEHLKDARADLGAKASDDEVLDRAYEYQDDYMMSNEPTGELADFIQGLRNQEQYYNFDADEVIGKINERAIDGGMTAMELDDLLRKSDSVMYADSMDTGDLVGNEIIRNAFNEAGFENIVMDASVAFPHMKNIPMGTKHIITSNPANLRSRFAKFDPAKADSADLLAANPATAALPGLLQDRRRKPDLARVLMEVEP